MQKCLQQRNIIKQKSKKHQDFNTTYIEERANVEKDAPISRDELNLSVVLLNIMHGLIILGAKSESECD